MIAAGVLLAAEGLDDAAQGVVVDYSSTPPVVTDGPYGETKELFGGFWLLDVSSKEEAVLGVLPVLTADQAETLRSGGPTGDLFEDLLVTTLQCLRSDEGDLEDWQQLHHVIERNPELVVRVKTHVDELAEEIVTHLSTRDGVDPTRARMALTLVAGIVQRSVEEIITDPTSGPLQQRIQTNLTLAREILTARG